MLILGLVLVYFSWPRMAFLFRHISTDPADLLSQRIQSVSSLLQIRKKVDRKRRFGVVFESENSEATKKALHDLAPLLEKNPLVGRVLIKKPGYDFFDKNKFLYVKTEDLKDIRDRIDRKIQREKLGGFYISFEDEDEDAELSFDDLEEKYRDQYGEGEADPYYVSPNQKIYALYVEGKHSNMDMAQEIKFQDSVRDIVGNFDYRSYDPNMKLFFGGSNRIMEYRALIRDLKVAGIISGIVIFLPLLIRFRRPQHVLLIFIPLLIGVPSGIALASVWIPRLNVTTSFLFAILGGLGVETGIHIFSRYYWERRRGLSIEETLMDMYMNVGRPVLTAVAALATTFLLMIFSDFRGFSEFGFISGIGLWTVFLLYFTFFPALLIFAEKIKILKFKKEIKEVSARINLSPGFVRVCLAIFALFTVFSIGVLPRIQFEYNVKKIRADTPEDRTAKLKQRLTTSKRRNIPAIALINSEEEAKALRDAVHKIRDENPDTKIDYASSIYSLAPTDQDKKMGIIREIQALLADDTIKLVKDEKKKDLDRFKKELERPEAFTLKDVPSEIQDLFKTKEKGEETVFLIFAKPFLELDDARNSIPFAEEIKVINTPYGNYHPSSTSIVFADLLKTMFRDSKYILLLSALCITLFVFLDFRNWKKTALVMFSIMTGVVWVMGVLYLLRIKLNLYNMVMIPAIMGMSVDNSIHVYHRYMELGKGSLSQVLSTTGVAAMLASLTNGAGFVGLAFASHGGLRSMGLVAVIGVITSLITTLVFMPMILQYLETRKGLALQEEPVGIG